MGMQLSTTQLVTEERELKEVWKKILTSLMGVVPKSQFLTWFKNTALLEIQDGSLIVGVPTDISFNNIAERYLQVLVHAAKEVCGEQISQVQLKVDGLLFQKDKRTVDIVRLTRMKDTTDLVSKIDELTQFEPKKAAEDTSPTEVALIEGITSKVLHNKYRLDNFVVGPETQLAYAACCAVARNPGEAYNPLFIYGGVGLGKTHLIQGTGNEVLKRFPKKKIVYVTSEKFMNELIEAIGNHKTDALRKKYRNIDVLIIDDIQFLAQKQQTQMEFFNTFNELYQDKKQIIISSDRPPKELTQLEERLKSRFEWGMIVDVQFPDFETRCAILRAKCQERGISLSFEVLEFIAHNISSSIRELEGVLNQALALYELNNITPSIKSIGPMLMKLNRKPLYGYNDMMQPRVRAKSIEEIIDGVAEFFHIAPEDIQSDSRKKEFVNARQLVMYLAKEDLKLTYERIGELLGGRIHSTVMHACSKVEKLLKKDEELKRDVNALRMNLGLLLS